MHCRNTDAAKWTGLYARTTPRKRIQYVHLPRETRSHKLDRIAPTSIRNSQLASLVRPVLSAEEIPLHGINAHCLASAISRFLLSLSPPFFPSRLHSGWVRVIITLVESTATTLSNVFSFSSYSPVS